MVQTPNSINLETIPVVIESENVELNISTLSEEGTVGFSDRAKLTSKPGCRVKCYWKCSQNFTIDNRQHVFWRILQAE